MGYIGVFQQARRQQPSEVGAGYKVYDVVARNGAEKDLVVFDHRSLVREIRLGLAYSRTHGGDLPDTDFWNTAADKFDDDTGFFALTHQCQPLLALLRKDDIFDRNNPPPIITPPIDVPGIPGVPPVDTPVVEVPPNNPAAVPEPSSVFLMALGLVAMYVARRRGRRIASAV